VKALKTVLLVVATKTQNCDRPGNEQDVASPYLERISISVRPDVSHSP